MDSKDIPTIEEILGPDVKIIGIVEGKKPMEVTPEACQLIGKLTMDVESIKAEYMRLLEVLRQVRDGELDPKRVILNMTPPGFWQIAAPEVAKEN